jgi:hypothetical protein
MNLIESYKSRRSALWKATLLFHSGSGALDYCRSAIYALRAQWIATNSGRLAGRTDCRLNLFLYERHRVRRFSEQLHVIDLMNHHIRNALQPLMFLTFQPEGRAQTKLVEECVRHIDWALREVLPGKSEEQCVVKPADSLEEVARDRAASSSVETKRPAGIYKQSA